MIHEMLANTRLDEVLSSTRDSLDSAPGDGRLLGLIALGVAMVGVLVALNYWRRKAAVPKAVNHHGKLVREVVDALPVKPAEMRKLRQAADQQGCSSPLVLMLCPSLLVKAMKGRPTADKQLLAGVLRRMVKSDGVSGDEKSALK